MLIIGYNGRVVNLLKRGERHLKKMKRSLFSWLLVLSMLLSPIAQLTAQATDENPRDALYQKLYEESLKTEDKMDLTLMEDVNPEEKVRVIVELSEEPIINKATEEGLQVPELSRGRFDSIQNTIDEEQKDVKTQIEEKGIELEEKSNYSVAINGFAAEVKAGDLEKIAAIDAVKKVYISVEYELPEPMMNTSVDLIDATQTWGGDLQLKGEGSVIAIIDSGVDPHHKDFVITDESKVALTSDDIDRLKAEKGLLGVYVNAKVPYAYDYYDAKADTYENKGSQHGMHVAGTVAANGTPSEGGIKGVAPEAQLLAMKVFPSDQSIQTVFSDIYLQAIEEAIVLGADAINMSLGSPAGFYNRSGESAEEVAFKNAVDNGVVCAVAAGNERNIVKGSKPMIAENPDLSLVGSPSMNPSTISVASFENTHTMSASIIATLGDETTVMQTSMHEKSPLDKLPVDAEIVSVGLGNADADYEGKDVTGKIALAERGVKSFTDKKNLALAHGASAIIIYNHAAGGDAVMGMAIDPPYDIPMAFIGHSHGEYLKANEAEVRVTFSADMSSYPNPLAHRMSDFSSWGPSADLRMKPEVTAPGGNIYSTQNDDGYTVMSGTSMATPHVAGAVGVVKQALRERGITGKEAADMTKQLFMNTAVPQESPEGHMYSVMQQGAGMINLYAAVMTDVVVYATGTNDATRDAKLELKELSNNQFDVNLELVNRSDESKSYRIESIGLKEAIVEGVFPEYSEDLNTIVTGEKEVTVPANGTANVNLAVSFEGVDHNQLVNGFIKLVPVGEGTNLSVPFLGFYGNWSEPKALDGFARYGEKSFFNIAGMYTGDLGGVPILPIEGQPVAVFNPKTGLLPIISILRNIEKLDVLITDEDGETERTINELFQLRKINRLDRGNPPYYASKALMWDGKILGKLIPDGTIKYLTLDAQLNYETEQPQRSSYAVTIDSTAPAIEEISYADSKVSFKVTDEFIGTSMFGIAHPTDSSQLVPIKTNSLPEFTEGSVVSVEVPASWQVKTVYVFAIDHLGNAGDQVFEVNIADEDPTPDPQNPENGAKPMMAFTNPELLTFVKNPVLVEGYIWDVEKVDSIKVEQVDPKTGEVLAVAGNAKVEADDVDIDKVYTGPGFKFTAAIQTVGDYPHIRVTASSKGATEAIMQRVWVDEQAPVIELKAKNCTNESTADVEVHVSDNFWYLEVHRVVDGELADLVYKKDGSYQTLVPFGLDETFTNRVKLEDGKNEITYVVFDANGLSQTATVTITKSEDCPIVDKSELQAAINRAKNVAIENYTQESVEHMLSVLEEAENVMLDENATQEQVDQITKALNDAIDALVETPEPEVVNKQPLIWLVKLAENENIEGDKEELEEAIRHAKAVIANEDATQKEVDEAFKKLSDAIKRIKPDIIEVPVPGEDENLMKMIEIYGENRYETAVEISQKLFETADHVVLALGENFPDALAAGSLANELKAPLLLTAKAAIGQETWDEIERLGAKHITVIGGANAISEDVIDEIDNDQREVDRIAGADRYETAVLVTKAVQEKTKDVSKVVLVNGLNPADALAITPYAGVERVGILLTNGTELDPATEELLLEAKEVVIAGGVSAVSEAIEKSLEKQGIQVDRVWGMNRFETAVKIAERFFKDSIEAVIAHGMNFPDALSGSQLAIQKNAPILLVDTTEIDPQVLQLLKDAKITTAYVLGGPHAISISLRTEIQKIEK